MAEEESSKGFQVALTSGFETLSKELGEHVGRILGVPAENLVGLLGGDWLALNRARNLTKQLSAVHRELGNRGVEILRELSPRLAGPALRAAADESDETLQGLWQSLLANALDPSQPQIKKAYIELLQKFEPAHAILFRYAATERAVEPKHTYDISQDLNLSEDEFEVSRESLTSMEVIEYTVHGTNQNSIRLRPLGRLLGNACFTEAG